MTNFLRELSGAIQDHHKADERAGDMHKRSLSRAIKSTRIAERLLVTPSVHWIRLIWQFDLLSRLVLALLFAA
jgi:hypothetical protein